MGCANKLLSSFFGNKGVVKKSEGAQGFFEVVIEKGGGFSESHCEER